MFSNLTLRRLARHLAIVHEHVSDGAARRLQGRLIPLLQDADALLDSATSAHFEALLGGRRPGPPPERDPLWPGLRRAIADAGLRRFIADAGRHACGAAGRRARRTQGVGASGLIDFAQDHERKYAERRVCFEPHEDADQ